MRRLWLASALPVGDSDTCKAKPNRRPWLESQYGSGPQSTPWLGMQAMLLPIGRPVRIMGLSGLDEVAVHEGGRLLQVLFRASRNATGRWVH